MVRTLLALLSLSAVKISSRSLDVADMMSGSGGGCERSVLLLVVVGWSAAEPRAQPISSRPGQARPGPWTWPKGGAAAHAPSLALNSGRVTSYQTYRQDGLLRLDSRVARQTG